MQKPYIIEFQKIGSPSLGYLSIGENLKDIPFELKRIFWTFYTPEEVSRGRHAHFETQMILIAAAGRIVVNTEDVKGNIETFILDKPNIGLYIPKMYWHTMQYSHNAVQLVLCSTLYNEQDYIRSYEEFAKHR